MSNTTDYFDYTKLPIPERIRLVKDICDSIAAEDAPVGLTPAQRDELDRRLEALDENPNRGIPLEEVKVSLLNRVKPIDAAD